ncbi:MAG: thiamine pyrophosphate-dependent enzyme [Phycisphaerae bacterium]
MSLLTVVKDEMCYCPGCSHGLVLERLAAAMQQLNLPPDKVCLVSDIGCIGTADRYFTCHTFHGLHGRSFTYAEGIRRMRPDLTVIVLVGDGGCGIGTAHLVHAARRGVEIKVLVCNNFNFGMTGGQHSPTTPLDGKTPTTPDGFHEQPFDICRTAIASGASFVGRCSALDAGATEMIVAAIQSPGFALLDIWELCTAYYAPTNKLTPRVLSEASTRFEMPMGVLWNRPRQRADSQPAAAKPARESRANLPALPWTRRVEICVAGSAGQHIRSAAGIIGEIAVLGGLWVAQQDDFPITVRKGHSISNLIIDREPIEYPGLDSPDIVLVLSDDGLARLGGLRDAPPKCRVFVERGCDWSAGEAPPPHAMRRETAMRIDLNDFGRGGGRASAALAALTFAIARSALTDPVVLCHVAQATLRGVHRDENLAAIRFGVARAADSPNSSTPSLAGSNS